jgi:steroid 5-alpha reductase family enzyme
MTGFLPSTLAATFTPTGVLHNALAPSLGIHAVLSLGAYGISRLTKRVDIKDWLWPSGLVLNAWYHALRPAFNSNSSSPVSVVLKSLPWAQQLLLGGVTVWGTRLFYRIVSRSLRRGQDDPRYAKFHGDDAETEGMWNKTLFSIFGMEGLAQSLIALSWSIPLSNPVGARVTSFITPSSAAIAEVVHNLAIALFTSGLALEILADYQLEAHKRKRSPPSNSNELQRSGVWSIVRHPNYLGDALVHLSFPLLSYASSSLTLFSIIGPLANYLFLRYVGGDKENESDQEERYRKGSRGKLEQLQSWRGEKNSFWPGVREVANPWTWIVVGLGAVGVGLEKGLKRISPMP